MLAILQNTVKKLVFIFIVTFTAGCIPQPEEVKPPAKKFSGKPIDFSVRFLGAGVVDRGILTDVNLINQPVKCSYTFGAQKGRFTTPATITFKHTGAKKALNLKCETKFQNKGGIFRRWYTGTVTGRVDTSFDTKETVAYVNRYLSGVRVPTNPFAVPLRETAIQGLGAQLLPNVIVLSPIVKITKK